MEKKLLENGREGHRWTSHLLKTPNPWSKLVTHVLERFEIVFSPQISNLEGGGGSVYRI